MTATAEHETRTGEVDIALWWRAHQLYSAHAELLDEQRLADWLELFEETCLYRVISRENHEAGLPLALMRCEGVPGLRDRVHAIEESSVFAPRTMRHIVSGLRVHRSTEPDRYFAKASYVVLQSLEGEHSTVHSCGTYVDELRDHGGELRFAAKTAIYDGALVVNSMVFPL